MKTAEEWLKSWDKANVSQEDVETHLKILREIQADALREAAKTTSRYLENNRLHPDIPNEQLNESARVAAHSVLQQAALEIMSLVEKLSPAERS